MLKVKTPEEVLRIIESEFAPLDRRERVSLDRSLGRVLAEEIAAREDVPAFDRSAVDGYALRAADSFGCSEALPAVLRLTGEVRMGQPAPAPLERDCCVYVPTGGAVPPGADCVAMLEHCQVYGDGTVGVLQPGAPGRNLIFRGDDVFPGKVLLRPGRVLQPQDLGALAALGVTELAVRPRLRIAVLSTGDELVPPETEPGPGQVRDVNGPLLAALLRSFGAEPVCLGILPDEETLLRDTASRAVEDCDGLILSGGSSVGVKDAACRVVESLGELLFHGIAIKPGKPALLGSCGGKPLLGLPGHPAAAFYTAKLFLLPLLARLEGRELRAWPVSAALTENLSANHGRAQVTPCRLELGEGRLLAVPLHAKSGLITRLAGADGYFLVARDCEGLPAGAEVEVYWN